jgi:hypothetical protein
MDELLQEFVDSRGLDLRIDREQGVLRGVKLLGLDSRNGRKYSPAALEAARGMYEGARVNVNHPKSHPLASRDYQDRLGLVRNIALRPGAGLFGDFHFNPKHALAEQLLWDAEHAPENVGFSHNVQARTVRHGDETLVEAILKVHSVDLVADPATTCGLFEQTRTAGGSEISQPSLVACTLEELRLARPDLLQQLDEQTSAELAQLRRRIDELETVEALRGKRDVARRLLAEFHLPDPDLTGTGYELVSESFLNSLLGAADETSMRDLVAERARLVRAAAAQAGTGRSRGKPVSREQGLAESSALPATTAEGFARAIR